MVRAVGSLMAVFTHAASAKPPVPKLCSGQLATITDCVPGSPGNCNPRPPPGRPGPQLGLAEPPMTVPSRFARISLATIPDPSLNGYQATAQLGMSMQPVEVHSRLPNAQA